MSRRGRAGAPSDDVLLEALDRLVATEGIVQAADRLGVSYRAASNCHKSRHVSRRMRDVLEKHLREQSEERQGADEGESAPADAGPGGGEGPGLQESEQDLRREVEALRAAVAVLRERMEAVEGRVSQEWIGDDDGVDVEDVDDGNDSHDGGRRRPVSAPRRIFPELITAEAKLGEDQIYGAGMEVIVEWREAWAERRTAPYTLDWLRAERRRLELEVRLIGEFGLTPPPADAPWRERRRAQEMDWRRRAIRRLRWQLPLTWLLHWLLRVLTLGLWGRAKGS